MTKIFLFLILILTCQHIETVDKQKIGTEVFDNLNKIKCLGSSKMVSYIESKKLFLYDKDEDTPLKVKFIYRLNPDYGNEELKIEILDSGFSLTTNHPDINEMIKRNGKYLEDKSSEISFAKVYNLNGQIYYISDYKQREQKYYWVSSSCKKQ